MITAIINQPVVPLYHKPNIKSERVDEVLYGMVVTILNYTKDRWAYVKTNYNYTGYIGIDTFVIEVDNLWSTNVNTIISSNFADILTDSKIQSPLVTCIPRGSNIINTFEISQDKLWTKVKLTNGDFGWILVENIREICNSKILPERQLRANLVSDAITYLPTQYRWGGKSPLGIDCSGLCSMVYMLNGINIYRDADIMPGFPIKEIHFSELGMGDLIFFPGHVAMYIGDNKYIHSSLSGNGVKINSLDINDPTFREDLAKTITKIGSFFIK